PADAQSGFRRVDYAHRDVWIATAGATDAEHELAGPRWLSGTWRGCQFGPGNAQHRDIARGITSGDRRGYPSFAVGADFDLLVALNDVVRGDDQILGPGNSCGGQSPPAV